MPKQSWVKLLYFYTVIGVSILFLCIGLYIGLSTFLKTYVFTEIGSNQFSYATSEESCKNRGSQFSSKISVDSTQPNKPLTTQELADCVQKEDAYRTKQERREFQENVLNSALMIAISGVVLGIHVFLFRSRNKEPDLVKVSDKSANEN